MITVAPYFFRRPAGLVDLGGITLHQGATHSAWCAGHAEPLPQSRLPMTGLHRCPDWPTAAWPPAGGGGRWGNQPQRSNCCATVVGTANLPVNVINTRYVAIRFRFALAWWENHGATAAGWLRPSCGFLPASPPAASPPLAIERSIPESAGSALAAGCLPGKGCIKCLEVVCRGGGDLFQSDACQCARSVSALMSLTTSQTTPGRVAGDPLLQPMQ